MLTLLPITFRPNIQTAGLPIRVNAIGPSWTKTGLVPPAVMDMVPDIVWQGPESAARSVAILMADKSRQGHFIYSWGGRFMEIEESKLLPVAEEIVGDLNEDRSIEKLHAMASKIGYV